MACRSAVAFPSPIGSLVFVLQLGEERCRFYPKSNTSQGFDIGVPENCRSLERRFAERASRPRGATARLRRYNLEMARRHYCAKDCIGRGKRGASLHNSTDTKAFGDKRMPANYVYLWPHLPHERLFQVARQPPLQLPASSRTHSFQCSLPPSGPVLYHPQRQLPDLYLFSRYANNYFRL